VPKDNKISDCDKEGDNDRDKRIDWDGYIAIETWLDDMKRLIERGRTMNQAFFSKDNKGIIAMTKLSTATSKYPKKFSKLKIPYLSGPDEGRAAWK
jgi:hypothetical protein